MKRKTALVAVLGVLVGVIAGCPSWSALAQEIEVAGSFLLVTGSPTQIIYSYHGRDSKTVEVSVESHGGGTLKLMKWTGISWRQEGEIIEGQGAQTYTVSITRGTKIQLVGGGFTESIAGSVVLTFLTGTALPPRAAWSVPPATLLPLSPPGAAARFVFVENSSDSSGAIDVMINGERAGGIKPGCFRIFDNIPCAQVSVKPEVDRAASGTYIVM